jgi:hypothetical protein
MSNPIKGEVTFESGGKEYKFKFGINAQVILEERAKMTAPQFMNKISQDRFGAADLRLLFYAGLHGHHELSETEVGNLIDDLGTERCTEIFLKAVGMAAPRGNGAAGRPTIPGLTGEQIGATSSSVG